MDKIAPFTDKCGCTNTPAFRRCPMHAAAPVLLEELRAMMLICVEELMRTGYADRNMMDAASRAHTAIRAAEGENK